MLVADCLHLRGYNDWSVDVVQVDENRARTNRIPIVLAGAECDGSETSLKECFGNDLGNVGFQCRHEADVYLVCYNGSNAGASISPSDFRFWNYIGT